MNSNFQAQFELAARSKAKVQFINSFKGLPVISEGLVLQVDREAIRIQCDLPQLACLQAEKQTYIKGADLQGTIQAQLASVDFTRLEAILFNFGRVKGDIGQRAQIRVEPEAAVTVVLQAGYHGTAVKSELVDISMSGIGVLLDRILYSPRLYSVGADLNIQVTLPPPSSPSPAAPAKTGALQMPQDLSSRFSSDNLRGLRGTGMLNEPDARRPAASAPAGPGSRSPVIISTHGQVEYYFLSPPYTRYRVGVSLEKSNTFKAIIGPYIAARQSDIVREFRLVYTSLVDKK